MAESKVKAHFDEDFAAAMGEAGVSARCDALLASGVTDITIKQAAELTGLDPFTIRSKTQSKKGAEPIWSKTYDAGGRVLVPVAEIAKYEQTKGSRAAGGRRMYKVYMTAEEAANYAVMYPDSNPRPANLNKAEKAAKATAEAEAEADSS
jgi:hypothetical protein